MYKHHYYYKILKKNKKKLPILTSCDKFWTTSAWWISVFFPDYETRSDWSVYLDKLSRLLWPFKQTPLANLSKWLCFHKRQWILVLQPKAWKRGTRVVNPKVQRTNKHWWTLMDQTSMLSLSLHRIYLVSTKLNASLEEYGHDGERATTFPMMIRDGDTNCAVEILSARSLIFAYTMCCWGVVPRSTAAAG